MSLADGSYPGGEDGQGEEGGAPEEEEGPNGEMDVTFLRRDALKVFLRTCRNFYFWITDKWSSETIQGPYVDMCS